MKTAILAFQFIGLSHICIVVQLEPYIHTSGCYIQVLKCNHALTATLVPGINLHMTSEVEALKMYIVHVHCKCCIWIQTAPLQPTISGLQINSFQSSWNRSNQQLCLLSAPASVQPTHMLKYLVCNCNCIYIRAITIWMKLTMSFVCVSVSSTHPLVKVPGNPASAAAMS